MELDAQANESLLLIGYVPLQPWGWALPCFGSRAGSNRICIARCSIGGDHLGVIADFEDLQALDPIRLPSNLYRSVEIGSPWIDVFLWDGVAHVGDPQTLWTSLRSELDDIARRAPLTVVDLAMDVARPSERRDLIQSARTWIEDRHGADHAEHWTLREAQNRVTILAARAGVDLSMTSIKVRLDKRSGVLLGDSLLPAQMRELEALSSEFAVAVQDWGVRLTIGYLERESGGERAVGATDADTRAVLVLVAGDRATEIARAARALEWSPIRRGDGPQTPWRLHDAVSRLDGLAPRIDLVQAADEPPRADYAAAIVLVDEDWAADRGALEGLVGRARGLVRPSGLVGFAPALPRDMPSHALVLGLSGSGAVFDFVVDTSAVRSPLRPIRARLSLDRKICDHILTAAALCGSDGPTVIGRPRQAEPPILGFAIEPLPDGSRSESQWDEEDVILAREPIRFLDATGRHPSRSGDLILSRRSPDFGKLTDSVLARVDLVSPRHVLTERSDIPPSASAALDFPNLSIGYHVVDGGRFCMVGEAPSLLALSRAAGMGVTLIRYSDEAALQRWLDEGAWTERNFLPDDFRIPGVRRLAANRRLATRGVDPRDVVVLSREAWTKLRGDRTSAVADEVRPYFETTNTRRAEARVAIPLARLVATGGRDAVATELLASRGPTNGRSKRHEDLATAWRSPRRGTTRFILEDGRLPIALLPLPAGFVPSQSWFILDAQPGVEALLRSTIFGVWMRATRSRGTGWTPRFSMTGAFETFPLVPPFRTVKDGSTAIMLDDSATARQLSETVRSDGVTSPSIGGEDFDPIEIAIRHAYGLDMDAGELEILERLIHLNAELAQREA